MPARNQVTVSSAGLVRDTDLNAFLQPDETIDFLHPAVSALAKTLRASEDDSVATARACFEWVRDEIRHSVDYRMNPVTCSASEVLAAGTGYCYAKAHLLAALLRANGIPAGLVYQRLSIGICGPPYCTHGLNAVYLPVYGWYRIDPRGNKPGVDAQFTPPVERLAFPLQDSEEYIFDEIHATPLPEIVRALRRWKTWDAFYARLPDVQGRKRKP
ncbi:MAG: transglutaminase family protein [Candidatus Hydrogenedentes bacterium]|nr:transglutaminase family protein [Candidatus Hydrogenedentota bacterium]